jgi:hypothetical protein
MYQNKYYLKLLGFKSSVLLGPRKATTPTPPSVHSYIPCKGRVQGNFPAGCLFLTPHASTGGCIRPSIQLLSTFLTTADSWYLQVYSSKETKLKKSHACSGVIELYHNSVIDSLSPWCHPTSIEDTLSFNKSRIFTGTSIKHFMCLFWLGRITTALTLLWEHLLLKIILLFKKMKDEETPRWSHNDFNTTEDNMGLHGRCNIFYSPVISSYSSSESKLAISFPHMRRFERTGLGNFFF